MRDAFLCEVPITVEPYFLILVVLFFSVVLMDIYIYYAFISQSIQRLYKKIEYFAWFQSAAERGISVR